MIASMRVMLFIITDLRAVAHSAGGGLMAFLLPEGMRENGLLYGQLTTSDMLH